MLIALGGVGTLPKVLPRSDVARVVHTTELAVLGQGRRDNQMNSVNHG